jgi:hypothetical protein
VGPHGNRRAPRAAPVSFGSAELVPDPARPRGWTLLVDGIPQSYVDLDDPEHVGFGYLRLMGRLVRAWRRGDAPVRVLHLGGGALTLARLLHHRWPGTAQHVVEHDRRLVEFVTRELGVPAGAGIEVGDARTALEGCAPGAYDLVVADVFAGAATPVRVASAGFAAAAARALAPGGLYLMNVTDVPPLAWTRVQTATLRQSFAEVAVIGDAAVVRGRRSGNVVLAAGAVPRITPDRHERLLRGAGTAEFAGGARPRPDAPA